MPDFERPESLPEWASEQEDPQHIEEPPQQRKKDGWDTDPPPHSYCNWWMRKVWEWLGWLDSKMDLIPDESTELHVMVVGAYEFERTGSLAYTAAAIGEVSPPSFPYVSYPDDTLTINDISTLQAHARIPVGALVTSAVIRVANNDGVDRTIKVRARLVSYVFNTALRLDDDSTITVEPGTHLKEVVFAEPLESEPVIDKGGSKLELEVELGADDGTPADTLRVYSVLVAYVPSRLGPMT